MASTLLADGADHGRQPQRRARGGAAPRARGRRVERRDRRVVRRSRARHVLPQLGEADPGAAGGACAAGPRRRRDRDRMCVASASPRPARARAASAGRGRARPRTTSSADRSRPGSSTTAPASMRRCCCSAASTAGRPRGTASRRIRASRRCSPRSLPRRRWCPSSMPTGDRRVRRRDYALTLERMAHAFSRLEALDGGARAADAMRAHPELIRGDGAAGHRAHASRRRLGGEGRSRRAPLRRAATGSASRSRSRTARSGRSAPGSLRSSSGSGSRRATWRTRRS